MKKTIAACLVVTGLTAAQPSQAAELKLFVAEVIEPAISELARQFEASSGHKLNIQFGAAVAQIKQLQAGEPFDLVIFPNQLARNPDNAALFVADTLTVVTRVGQGVAVRKGAAKPDIGSEDAFKQTLLKAQTVAFFPAGASGQQTIKMFERLGIADAMKAKTKPQQPENVVAAAANGDAELVLFLNHLLVSAPGVDYVGPYPGDLQQYIVFSAAVGAKAKEPEAAKALIKYLAAPPAAALIKAKGMEPG